jgi:hypothetical protein
MRKGEWPDPSTLATPQASGSELPVRESPHRRLPWKDLEQQLRDEIGVIQEDDGLSELTPSSTLRSAIHDIQDLTGSPLQAALTRHYKDTHPSHRRGSIDGDSSEEEGEKEVEVSGEEVSQHMTSASQSSPPGFITTR